MRRLAVISDLHADINRFSDDELELLAHILKQAEVDHLHLAGDIANKTARALAIVDFFRTRGLNTTFNWGNHEMADLTEKTIEAYPSPVFLNLQTCPLTEETVLLGYNGWYDYLFAADYNPEKIRQLKQLYWYDRVIPRKGSDPEVEARLRGRLKLVLDRLQMDNKKVILATHFVPKREFIVYQEKPEFLRWNDLNAFLGSAELGELLDRYDNVTNCVFGHTHRRFADHLLQGTRYSCRPLGYFFEWELTKAFVFENELVTEYRPAKLRSVLKKHQEAFAAYRKEHLAEEFRKGMTIIDIPEAAIKTVR
ncbi:metallophosphoesterase [Enterococcus sp. AD013-P3]|uniref:metallophosphoesterase n=1 Tax=Enterococcus sp. AD013-P3 TaxID=3411036 RepID=UPI003B941076